MRSELTKKKLKSFTLVELLIVIAMIGILASIAVVAGVGAARKKASDSAEIAHLAQIMESLTIYYSDYGEYVDDPDPAFPDGCHPFGSICIDCSSSERGEFLKGLQNDGYYTEEKIREMFDPDVNEHEDWKTCYYFTPDKQNYKFVSILYNKEKMINDGGINNGYYEVGNDLSLPIYNRPSLYK